MHPGLDGVIKELCGARAGTGRGGMMFGLNFAGCCTGALGLSEACRALHTPVRLLSCLITVCRQAYRESGGGSGLPTL